MSTPVKFLLFFVGFVLVIGIALTVLIKTQITPEKVRETLLPIAEKSLDRDVDFGAIQIGLFSGISVADLKVMQKNGSGEFFSVGSVEFHYQFWPLLKGQVVVDQILFDQPKINVIRFADGRFNFSDLLTPSTPAESTGKKTQDKSVNDAAKVFNLLVKEVNLKDGELFYVDRFKNSRAPFHYALKKLNFKARQITLDSSFPVDLSAVINDSNIDISGNYDFSTHAGDLTVHLAPLDLIQFTPYYRDRIPGKLGSALLSLNVELDVQPEMISSKGKITLEDVDLVLDQFPDAGIEGAKLGADYALNYELNKQLLKVSTLLLSYNKVDLGAEGELDLSATEPFLVLSLLFDHFDLREVMQSLPPRLAREYEKYSFAGTIDGQVDLAGKLDSGIDLFKSAKLHLSDVRATAENLRAGIGGDIIYENRILQSENLLLQYGAQQATLQLKVERTADDLFEGDFNLSAKTLDLNKIVAMSEDRNNSESAPQAPVGQQQKTPAVQRQKTLAEDVGPFDLPLDLVGSLTVNRVIYKQLKMDNVAADLLLKNNYLSVRNFYSQLGGGEFRGSTVVNLGIKGLSYEGQFGLSQPNINTLISGLKPDAAGAMSGVLQWQNNFSGRGTLPDVLLRALQLKGQFSLKQGKIKSSPVAEQLAGFLGNSDLKLLSFKSFTGEYDLQDGLLHLSSYLDSSKTKLVPSGTVDIDGLLNLKLDARFAPEILEKLKLNKELKKAFVDQNGWGQLPLRIKGTFSHPEISYDAAILQDKMVEKASEKLLDKLVPEDDENAESLKQMLDGTLNKLFGK
jgi:AsmA protein